MSDDNIKNHLSNTNGNQNLEEPIQPIDFTPVGQTSKKFSLKLSPVKVILSAFFLIFASAAWFVLSAKSVYLDVTPATSIVNVESPLAIKIGPRFLVLKGDLPVTVTAEGYYPLDTDLIVTDQQAQTFVINMQPLPGFLTLNSDNISGAQVFIDGQMVGETPLTDLEVDAGDHMLSVTLIDTSHLKQPFLWKGDKQNNA